MDRNIRRKRRRIIYKPDYAGLHQVAVAKRIVGILLALVLTAGVGYLAVRLVVPAVWSALQPSPVRQEEREEKAEERAREKGKTLLFDEKTDLPLYENTVNLFVINEKNPADDSFEIELKTVSGIRVDERIAPALEAMVEAAWADEAEIELLEGYVSYEEQKALFDEQVDLLMLQGVTKIMSYSYAKDRVQPPGECDFQSGMCITLKGDPDTFETTEVCSWLENHMAEYGFVFRYPVGKEKYTGVEGTKLVLRYVGPENAAIMRRLSMSIEEYIKYLG